MTQQDVSKLNQLVDQYMALWHEPDAELRRRSIAELWVEDGAQFLRSREYHGYKALEERVASAHEEFVKKGGFVFKLSSDAKAHHDAVTFTWEMVPASGGEVAAVGTIFLLLNNDGRIHSDYQF